MEFCMKAGVWSTIQAQARGKNDVTPLSIFASVSSPSALTAPAGAAATTMRIMKRTKFFFMR